MLNFQVFINILQSGLIYLLLAISFTLIYFPAKFFHLAHAVVITFGAYFTFLFSQQLGLPLYFSIPLAITAATIFGVICEVWVYKPLRKRNVTPLVLLIASLGIYIILQNVISLIWGDETKSIRIGEEIKTGNEIFGAYITNIQIIIIIVSIVLFIAILLLLKYTKIGKNMQAVSSNKKLSNIYGINSNYIILWSFGLGSALASIAGILVAFNTDMTPTMGFNLLLYGVVVMIIGGIDSTWGLVGGSILLAAAQQLGAFYMNTKWMDAIVYIILILFLIWKPLGFSGRRLKKIEI